MKSYKVKKHNGDLVPMDITQIRKQTTPATAGLSNVSAEDIEQHMRMVLSDGISTKYVQRASIMAALNMVDIDTPNYTYVAARLALYGHYHDIKRLYNVQGSGDVYKKVSVADYIEYHKDRLDAYYTKYSAEEIATINSWIVGIRDELHDYLGYDAMYNRYLISDGVDVSELPQHMHMAIAMCVNQNEDPAIRMKLIKDDYDDSSRLMKIYATPIYSNCRLKDKSTMSCLVGHIPDDLSGMFDMFKEIANGSKGGSGWGIDWSKVRSLGSNINGIKGAAGGKIPFLKILNDISIAVDQLGNRPGAFAVYIENWDIDIFDFLDLKKKNGEERRRAQDLFIAVTLSDLYMEREANDAYWTLFDPYDVPELTELHGEAFKAKYIEYEEEYRNNPERFNHNTNIIKAKEFMRKLVTRMSDDGQPFIYFKDTANRRHNHPELGIIRSLNLCTEIAQATDEHHTAVCNLGSINLARVTTKPELRRVAKGLLRNLDNIVDISTYPSEKAERTQKERRSTGVGMLGEAELIANLGIYQNSKEHRELIDEIYGTIAEALEEGTIELAIEKGSCIIPGKRNAYLSAIAPNSTSGLFAGTTNSHEAVFDTKWVEDNIIGNVVVTAPNINAGNIKFYQNPYELDPIETIITNSYRYAHIDQAISQNLYLDPVGLKASTIRECIVTTHKVGNVSIYYTRTKPPKNDAPRVNDIACFGCTN